MSVWVLLLFPVHEDYFLFLLFFEILYYYSAMWNFNTGKWNWLKLLSLQRSTEGHVKKVLESWNYSNCCWSFYLNKSIHLNFQNTMKNINSSQQPLLVLLYLLIMIKLKCHILMTDWRKQMTNAQNARWLNQVRRCWYTLLGGTSELHAVRLKQRLRFKSALNVFLQATVSDSSTEHWSSSKNSW